MRNAAVALAGTLGTKVIRGQGKPETMASLWRRVLAGLPFGSMSREVRMWRIKNLPNLMRGLYTVIVSRIFDIPCFWGELYLRKISNGMVTDYGLASLRVVTTAGVGYIVDAFQNSVELENMKYHAFGTGTGDEAVGDTGCGTELTTEYTVDNTRPTGSTEEGATANIYKTIATFTCDSGTPAVTEHAIMSQASNAGGVCLDRSKFAAINMVATDSIVATYQLTLTAGS
jgi:hypothetical protein